jgi:hypothetical protein
MDPRGFHGQMCVDPVVIFQIVVHDEEVERKLDGSRSKHLERGDE